MNDALQVLCSWFEAPPPGRTLEPAIDMTAANPPAPHILDVTPDGAVYDTVDGEILGLL